MGQSRPLFGYFRSFLIPITISKIQIEKSLDGVLGIQTWGRRMVGPDKTTELWRVLHPKNVLTLCKIPRIVIYNRIVIGHRPLSGRESHHGMVWPSIDWLKKFQEGGASQDQNQNDVDRRRPTAACGWFPKLESKNLSLSFLIGGASHCHM